MIARKSNKMNYYSDTIEEKLSVISDIIYHSSGIRDLEFWCFDNYYEGKNLVDKFYNNNCSTKGQEKFEENINNFKSEEYQEDYRTEYRRTEYRKGAAESLDKIIDYVPMVCGKDVDKFLKELSLFDGYRFVIKLSSIQFFDEIKNKDNSWEITNAYLKVSPELVKCIRAYWMDKRNLPVVDGLILIRQEDLKETLKNIPKDIEWVKYVMGVG